MFSTVFIYFFILYNYLLHCKFFKRLYIWIFKLRKYNFTVVLNFKKYLRLIALDSK